MPNPSVLQEVLVLGRHEHAEVWWRLDLLTDEGVEGALLRRRKQGEAGGVPDLFDTLEVELERREGGGVWFVKAHRLLQRREGLGRSYAALTEACRWADWLRRHGAHLPDPAAIRALLAEALTAWETGQAPAAVGIKFGWRLARSEGWPVKEDWLVRLNASELDRALEVLRTPVAELDVPPASLASLCDNLLGWLEEQVR